MYSHEEIRESYKNYDNYDIVKLAKESKRLRKDVLPILKEEIEKRNLDKNLVTWIETETNSIEGNERRFLIDKIQHLNCPKCHQKEKKSYGFEINKVVSLILYAHDTTKERVLCENCGKKEKIYAILTTFFAGWWSRKGVLLTPWIVIKDSFNYLFLDKISNRILNRIIDENTGYFRRKGTGDEVLIKLIKKRNEQEINEEDGFDFY